MKYSGIGGQAVMEGVMMRNGARYALAVRKSDHTIAVETHKTRDPSGGIYQIPILRGIVSFVDSLVMGMSTLMQSAAYFEDEEEAEAGKQKDAARKEREEKVEMGMTVAIAIVLAVAIFMVLPYFLSRILEGVISSQTLLVLVEGLIRIAIFVGYLLAISRMEDIRRVFMYHGAEHKCINCIENGLELNVENVRKSSRQHRRCGTSFLLIVLILSILVSSVVTWDSLVLRVVLKIACLPLVVGIAYEIIKFAGRHDNILTRIISAPGLWLQRLTTAEPDASQVEVALASFLPVLPKDESEDDRW